VHLIPIHQGKHFTCAVIYMQDKQIMYYDSYLNTGRTRALCSHKKENQMRILQALLQYLKDEHLNKHSVDASAIIPSYPTAGMTLCSEILIKLWLLSI
jgi:hypothetical protein